MAKSTINTVSEVLDDMYHVLVVEGRWSRGQYYNKATDCYCIVGAAGYMSEYFLPGGNCTPARFPLYDEVLKKLEEALKEQPTNESLINWNDRIAEPQAIKQLLLKAKELVSA